MNKFEAIGLALLTLFLSGIIGHFYAPNGILFTPIIMSITSTLICFGLKTITLFLRSLLTYIFIALNDISLKLFAGGSHDYEGYGVINFFLIIGLIPTLIILLVVIIKNNDVKSFTKMGSFLLFLGLILTHLYVFSFLGLGRVFSIK